MEYKVNILKEFYTNDDFHLYSGIIEGELFETSFKTNGFSLSSDNGFKILVGDQGNYKGQKTVSVKYEKTDYKDPETQKQILTNLKNVGDDKALNIMESLNNNIFNVLNENFNESEIKIKGFGKKTLPILLNDIKNLLNNLNENNLFNELQVLLSNVLKAPKIREISKYIKDVSKLQNNPYLVLVDYAELGFKKADEIALNTLNIDKGNDERIAYLIEYILNKAIKGNTYMILNDFIEELEKNNIENPFEKIMNNKKIKIEDEKCYPLKLYHAENEIPNIVNSFINNKDVVIDDDVLDKYIKEAENKNNIKYDLSQKNAIKNVVNNNFTCLIGGAGTGKSTTLKAVISVLKRLRYSCKCLAPTGKASRRLSETTELESSTIHSYIYQMESNSSFSYENVLIVDEFSMCDTLLLYNLLEICLNKKYKKIILVGDAGQLPSVQPGNNLYDFINSKVINIVELNVIHRQKSLKIGKKPVKNNIIDYASNIRRNAPILPIKEKDLYFQTCYSTEDFYKQIDKMYEHLNSKYKNKFDFLDNVQFIAPLKKGNCGCEYINKYIQDKYNDNPLNNFLKFKVNDKVMNIKNNKDKNIFNGETGIITDISKTNFTVYFNCLDKSKKFRFEEKNNFILAYCATIHKLQGSEYKYIIMLIESDSIFLDSRILYTGITRGKQTVIILSNQEIFNKIIKRNNTEKRYTGLQEKLIKTLSKKEDKNILNMLRSNAI